MSLNGGKDKKRASIHFGYYGKFELLGEKHLAQSYLLIRNKTKIIQNFRFVSDLSTKLNYDIFTGCVIRSELASYFGMKWHSFLL